MSEIGEVVKVVDSHRCGWGSIPNKSCSFLIVFLTKGLSLYFMYSDQHVKYRMPRGFSLTSSLQLDYHVKTIHTHNICRYTYLKNVLDIFKVYLLHLNRQSWLLASIKPSKL